MDSEEMSENTIPETPAIPEIPTNSEDSEKTSKKWYSLSSIGRFIGVSSIVTLITFALTNYFSIQSERQKDMTDYLKVMSDLMLDKQLYPPEDKKGILALNRHKHAKWLARALTLNLLRRLDGYFILDDKSRKGQLIKFLYESRLIGHCPSPEKNGSNPKIENCEESIINLQDAKFSETYIYESVQVLQGIDLKDAVLKGADLSQLDLTSANFTNTRLQNTKFTGTELTRANLKSAYLQGAQFSDANIFEADFTNSQLCGANLKVRIPKKIPVGWSLRAKFDGATYDDKTIFPAEDIPIRIPKDKMRKGDCTKTLSN